MKIEKYEDFSENFSENGDNENGVVVDMAIDNEVLDVLNKHDDRIVKLEIKTAENAIVLTNLKDGVNELKNELKESINDIKNDVKQSMTKLENNILSSNNNVLNSNNSVLNFLTNQENNKTNLESINKENKTKITVQKIATIGVVGSGCVSGIIALAIALLK